MRCSTPNHLHWVRDVRNTHYQVHPTWVISMARTDRACNTFVSKSYSQRRGRPFLPFTTVFLLLGCLGNSIGTHYPSVNHLSKLLLIRSVYFLIYKLYFLTIFHQCTSNCDENQSRVLKFDRGMTYFGQIWQRLPVKNSF